jgi:hypothetical protein
MTFKKKRYLLLPFFFNVFGTSVETQPTVVVFFYGGGGLRTKIIVFV